MRSFFLVSIIIHSLILAAMFNHALNFPEYAYCNMEPRPIRFMNIELKKLEKSADSMSDSWSTHGKNKKSEIKRLNIPPDKKQKEELRRFREYIENEYSLKEKESGELLNLLKQSDQLKEKGFSQLEHLIPGSGVDEKYIYRKRRYKEIIVKDVFPTINTINKSFESIIKQSEDDLTFFEKRNSIIKDYESWKGGQKFYHQRLKITIKKNHDTSNNIPPLDMNKDHRMHYLDSTLIESKEKQLDKFIQKFLSFHPDKGDLPLFIRELYYENLQRLAYRFSYDPTFFFVDYFQENLNKETFLKNAIYLMSRLKGTQSQIELGFTVENIYEIQSNAWDFFYEFKNIKKNLKEKDFKKTRIHTLNLMEKKYSRILMEENIHNKRQLKNLYFQKRIEIMNFLEKGNEKKYRLGDVYFQRGKIYWQWYAETADPQKRSAALKEWEKAALYMNSSNLFQKELKSVNQIIQTQKNAHVMNLKLKMFFIQNLRDQLASKKERESKLLWNKK